MTRSVGCTGFDPCDPDEDGSPADTCRECGALQGDHAVKE